MNSFNAAKMGPKRDVVREMERAIRRQGLRHFSEKRNPDLMVQDIRFTTNGDHLYAICMGIPVQSVRS